MSTFNIDDDYCVFTWRAQATPRFLLESQHDINLEKEHETGVN